MLSYYDIDDILLAEEPISAVFQIGANGVGLLDPGSETNNVEKSAKVDLPLWLANELYLRQAVSINVPSYYSLKTRKEIQADAACVDLRFRSPYFYELGCKLLPLVADKSIGPFLRYAFTSSFLDVAGPPSDGHCCACSVWGWCRGNCSMHKIAVSFHEAFSAFRWCLQETKPLLYFLTSTYKCCFLRVDKFPFGFQVLEAARSSMVAFKKWRVGGSRLEKASILGRKRKPRMLTQPSDS